LDQREAAGGEEAQSCRENTSGRRGQCGGRGGGRRARMERGSLRFVLLDALRDGPRHGYEIIKGLEERTHGQYAPSAGAIYPTLQYLTELGHIQATQEGDRRVYTLTAAGHLDLQAQAERIAAFWAGFAVPVEAEPCRYDVDFLEDALEDLTRTVWRGLREPIARGDRERIRRVRQSIERCREEVRGVIAGD
jgi:DNA-binding PadR family transcriptional regulator